MDINQKEKYKYEILRKAQKYRIYVNSINITCVSPESQVYCAEITLSDKYETKDIYIQFYDTIQFVKLLDDEIEKFMIYSIYLKLNKENV